jgi:hypothetical protein
MRILPLTVALATAFAQTSWAFCGFYVATSDQPLVNRASRVVLAHTADHTMVTMASDVVGDPEQFAIVIPVPTVITKEQVQLVRPETVEHLAEFTKPRLVEYYDADPCAPPLPPPGRYGVAVAAAAPAPAAGGVRIEAQYSVGEYDIVVLSATESTGLMDYLTENHYRIPQAAQPTIGSYIRQHMHFFLAKVNLERMKNNPTGFLRPIRVEYNSPKFMLPIRLGTVNATGPQDMIVLALTERGRVETTNYRTARMPTGVDVPLFVQQQFGQFYDATFERQVAANGGDAVLLEYAWNIGSIMCDPCSAPAISQDELRELGASWVQDDPTQVRVAPGPLFVTRLHVRYDRAHFPEDLQLQETPDQENFQVRFVTHHPFSGDLSCSAGQDYKAMLSRRFANEASTLASLSGWSPGFIAGRMEATGELAK